MANRTVRVELRAEIGDYLAKLQQASAATTDLAHKTAETAQTNREAWSRVGTGFTVMGAAAAAGFGLATKTAMDFDAQMSAVKATGSEAAANIGQLREAAMQAGAASVSSPASTPRRASRSWPRRAWRCATSSAAA